MSTRDSDSSDDDWFTKDLDKHVVRNLPNKPVDSIDSELLPAFLPSPPTETATWLPKEQKPKQPRYHQIPIKRLELLLEQPLIAVALEILPPQSGFLETVEKAKCDAHSIITLLRLLATVSTTGAFRVHMHSFLRRVLDASAFWSHVETIVRLLVEPPRADVECDGPLQKKNPKKAQSRTKSKPDCSKTIKTITKQNGPTVMHDLCTFAENLLKHGIMFDGQLLEKLLQAIDSSTANEHVYSTHRQRLSNVHSKTQSVPIPHDIFAQTLTLFTTTNATEFPMPAPNRISGPYDSPTDYLRTHMDLLRCDFMSPLAAGLQQLRTAHSESPSGASSGDDDDVPSNSCFWVYNEKRIIRQSVPRSDTIMATELVVRLTQDECRAISGRRAPIQRNGCDVDEECEPNVPFMAGSLLVFSSSVALQDLVLATVVEWKPNDNLLHIQLVRVFNMTRFLDRPLLMLECKAYFEPHHQVHRTLASFNAHTLPMQHQLIRVTTQSQAPDYLQEAAVFHTSDNRHALPLLAAKPWPEPEILGYNAGQAAAVRHALTHRVALVQGPPGTGKTFVGLELIRLLLHNTDHRIVVVCYTNHALDQFLLGLLKSIPRIGGGLVRLGGQCREEALRPYGIRALNEGIRTGSGQIQKRLFEAHQAISECNAMVDETINVGRLNEVLEAGVAARGRLEEMRQLADYEAIKGKRVVGMTSSFAARNGSLLQLLQAPIVMVEEAAELLESHVIASLTAHTQHLIMIGDHEQLRPTTFWHTSGVESHMNISLFERLHNNKLPAVALSQQHRMHSVIAELIRPSIYEHLTDAPNVFDYPPVRGMPSRLQFIDHRHGERSAGTSKTNPGEAKLVQRLCAHLLQQGYATDDITVLCTYRAQLALLQTEPRSGRCHGVRVAVVDGFQGRESRIVLLSLVRNNQQGSVGYMEATDRACVALSRAREGLFMFGNLAMLAERSDAWAHVRQRLAGTAYGIGEGVMVLRCERHGRESKLKRAEDVGCDLCQSEKDEMARRIIK